MIVHADENIVNEINQEVTTIKESSERLINLVQISNQTQKRCENLKRQQNPYIVKSVIRNMAKGLNMTDAALLTAKEFKTTCERVEAIMWGQKRYYSAIRLFARRYLCEKLKEAGFKTSDIAKIAKVSPNHVYKMLKVKPDFWFLECKPMAADYPNYF